MSEHSDIVKTILSTIKTAEKLAKIKDIESKDKKKYVLKEFESVHPDFYKEHSGLIEVLIDTFVHIGNNPEVIKLASNSLTCCMK